MTSFHMKIHKIQISAYLFFSWLLLCYNRRSCDRDHMAHCYGQNCVVHKLICPSPTGSYVHPQCSSIWRHDNWEIIRFR